MKWNGTTAFFASAALLGAVAVAVALQLYVNAERLDESLAGAHQRNDQLQASLAETEAEIERARREIDAAAALRRRAAETAAREALLRRQAESQKLSAEEEAEFLRLQAEAARKAAEQARLEAEAERRRREAEWGRLQSALNATAPTSRDGWTLTVRLRQAVGELSGTKFDRRSRERLSRLAGAFLAHQGYRVRVIGGADGRPRAVELYLEEAGVPSELVEAAAGSGELRLEVLETIFGKG